MRIDVSNQSGAFDWHVVLRHLGALAVLAAGLMVVLWLVRRWLPFGRRLVVVQGMFTLVCYLAIAAYTVDAFMYDSGGFRGDLGAFGLEPLLQGTARRPYVYRRLSADIVRGAGALAAKVLPTRALDYLEHESPLKGSARADETWDRQKAVDFHAAYAFVYFGYLATLLLARYWTKRVVPGDRLFTDIAPVIGMLMVPLTFENGSFLYDPTELALLFASALCVMSGAVWVHLVIFALAVFNKESNLLLIPIVFGALYNMIPRRRWLLAGIAHGIVGLAILFAVRQAFALNPGGTVEYRLPANVMFWTDPINYLRFTTLYAPLLPIPRGASLLLVIPVLVFLKMGWAPAPERVRRLLVIALVCVAPLMLWFSDRAEMRNLSLAFPALYAVVCLGLRRVYATDPSVA